MLRSGIAVAAEAGMSARRDVAFRDAPQYRIGMAPGQTDLTAHPWFFCGIGGSGMLPLGLILRGRGAQVAGSDRSRDQGRTPEKFAWLEELGFTLFPQDGSGMASAAQTLVASAAVEDTVPEVVRARELGCPRMSRAELLATLFNGAPVGIAVGGTSGKSTVTGMIGWILTHAGRDPTIMNGAVMKNFVDAETPFASARVGKGPAFVAEVDESDGSIALYRPRVAVLGNISLDHKSMAELRTLFGDFLAASVASVVNFDDPEAAGLAHRAQTLLSFGIDNEAATIGVTPGTIAESAGSISAVVRDRRDGATYPLVLRVPGRHNLSNALAAIGAASVAGVPVGEAVAALASFRGLARRFDIVGTSASGITVIDDFGHNPDKVSATLATLKAHPGRVIAFFQPHGYGPLRQMGAELAAVFARLMGPEDLTILCDPVYFGGTVDRSEGSERIVGLIEAAGGRAEYIASREDCAIRIAGLASPGDRIVVMGARDDTLTTFARDVLNRLG
jgi:UDP-N-acetylmuramate--alanine ligase